MPLTASERATGSSAREKRKIIGRNIQEFGAEPERIDYARILRDANEKRPTDGALCGCCDLDPAQPADSRRNRRATRSRATTAEE